MLTGMDPSAFRRHGHELVDWIAEYLEHPEKYPVLSRVKPGDIAAALPSSAPEEPESFDAIMADFERVLVPGLTHWNHPGFLAYFAITASAPGILAELLSAALNQQAMLWRTSPASTELEAVALGWLRKLIGLPEAFDGVIYDTASIATMHALVAAREAALPSVRLTGLAGRSDVPPLAVYCSEEAHSASDKALIAIGLGRDSLRKIPVDDLFRLRPEALAAEVARDRSAGVLPIAVVATVGTTSTTSIDPVPAIADICAAENLWLHVDAAYGGFAVLTPKGRAVLAGIERADSVTLDPHKWLFQPMECGSVLIRDGAQLERTFAIHPDYLDVYEANGDGEVNFADRGLQLSRGFRALKVWVSVQTFGLAAFRTAIQRSLELAEFAEAAVRGHTGLTLMAPATLGIVCFRREWPGCDEAETERRGIVLIDALERAGTALVSSTRLAGRHAVRLCALNPTSTEDDVRRVIEHFANAPAPPPGQSPAAASALRADVVTDPDIAMLRTMPLLSGVRDWTIRAVRARAVRLDAAVGEEVVRRWDSDRSFYLVLSGRYDVSIDTRLIRTLGPGDYFGELAARDWGGGYGYTRLATVRCAEPGRLLKLTSEDFQWLTETEPTVQADIAKALAERLQQR